MIETKTIAKEAILAALERAERYRLLNEPLESESICLDVLEVEPDNQQALTTLILSLADQLESRPGPAFREAKSLLDQLSDDYHRAYYHGVLCERKGKIHLHRRLYGDRHAAYDWFRRAMDCYEEAQLRRPPGNDESILRWNTCARILNRHPELEPAPEEAVEFLQ